MTIAILIVCRLHVKRTASAVVVTRPPFALHPHDREPNLMQSQSAILENFDSARAGIRLLDLKDYPIFEEIYRVVKEYIRGAGIDRSSDSESVSLAFAKTTSSRGSFLSYRASVNHLLRYLKSINVSMDAIDSAKLDGFGQHVCTAACRPSRRVSGREKVALQRFRLFLQYQGLAPSYGWDSMDPDTCFWFLKALIKEGVHPDVAAVQAKNALHFIIWARLKGIDRCQSGSSAEQFTDHNCSCGLQTASGALDVAAKRRRQVSVDRFSRFLTGHNPVFRDGVFIQRRRRCQPSPSVLRYRDWLTRHKGLRSNTVQNYTLDVMSWLPKLGEDASAYTAGAIRDMAMVEFAKRGTSMQSRLIRSARSYLHFRAFEGHCSHSLGQALISRPTYRLSGVPRRLDVNAVHRVIDSCDASTRRGLRDRAVLLLLAELGLRAAEVWRIKLQDLDWAEAKLTIEGKGGAWSRRPAHSAIRGRGPRLHRKSTTKFTF